MRAINQSDKKSKPSTALYPVVAIQHPGRISGQTTYARPASRWPDYRAEMPPRGSVVAIYREDGGQVGD